VKIRFIVNLLSGRRGRVARLLPLLRDFAERRGLGGALFTTEGPGHATELARAAVSAGCERVVSIGGDGTMNEVAQALVGGPVALALVRCGSGNGLSRHLGIPASPLAALDLACNPASRVVAIDTGTANGRPFFNAMGMGFDAEVGRKFSLNPRRGLAAYAGTVLREFAGYRAGRWVVTAGSGPETLDALLVAVANSEQYGNGAAIAPGARVDDGLLDLVSVAPVGFVGAAVLGARMFLGTIDRSPHVRHRRGAAFLVERPAPGLIHTDGECHDEAAAVSIRVVPASLRVVVPGSFADARKSCAVSANPRAAGAGGAG